MGKCRNDGKAARQKCNDNRNSCLKPFKDSLEVRKECDGCQKTCKQKARDKEVSIHNKSAVSTLPARWCKRLSPTRECLDPTVKMPINGGWGDCPEDKRMQYPNTGNGRLTIIQNLERWTKFHGLFKRVMVLPSDWSHLGSAQGRSLFQAYADDETKWKKMFKQAFNKVAALGGEGLATCTKVSCTVTGGVVSCPVKPVGFGNAQNQRATARMQKTRESLGLPPFVRPATLDFPAAQCDPPLAATSNCELNGGYGVKAKISCAGYTGYCTTAAASATESRIAQEWKEGGGQEPQCQGEGSMLDTDAGSA